MENKVLIRLICPEYGKEFDVFIPVNELLWKIKSMLIKAVSDLCNIKIENEAVELINKYTGQIYKNNLLVIDTDIRNSTELLFFTKIIHTKSQDII